MGENEQNPRFAEDSSDGDEVEILEVVGYDDAEAPAPSERTEDESETDVARSAADPDEVLLDIEEDDESPLDETAAVLGVADVPEPGRGPGGATEAQLLRLQADYDNLRKRIARERQDYEQLANASLIGRLLPVLDNFERALSAAELPNAGAEAFGEGVSMIRKQLFDELSREGLREIDCVGRPFDPNLHDAVATDESSESPPNTVVEELQRGYIFQNRVLRPALVKVSTRGGDLPYSARSDDEGAS